MKKLIVLFAAVMMTALTPGASFATANASPAPNPDASPAKAAKKKANRDTAAWRYEIEYAKTGANGMLVVKVWSYAKKPAVALEQCKKNAVHGVIFKGYTSSETGAISQRPLVTDPDAANRHKDFFDEFFADGGPYMKYVSSTAGNVDSRKVGREYKVGAVVTVNKDQLRKDLEAAGIIRALGAGF